MPNGIELVEKVVWELNVILVSNDDSSESVFLEYIHAAKRYKRTISVEYELDNSSGTLTLKCVKHSMFIEGNDDLSYKRTSVNMYQLTRKFWEICFLKEIPTDIILAVPVRPAVLAGDNRVLDNINECAKEMHGWFKFANTIMADHRAPRTN
jgi:ribosome-interacting GTPase 1